MDAKVVFLVDVIDSRKVSDFALQRDQALERISKAEPAINYQYAITAWDEIQFLLENPSDSPKFFWRLISHFQPLQLRIGIGIGSASVIDDAVMDSWTNDKRRAINEVGFGPAFEAARDALNTITHRVKQSSRSRVHAEAHEPNAVLLSNSALSALCNAILEPLSVLIQDISANQWIVLQKWNETDRSQTDAAEALGVNVSTVSRSLNRANIWLIQETLSNYEIVLKEFFAQEDTKQ